MEVLYINKPLERLLIVLNASVTVGFADEIINLPLAETTIYQGDILMVAGRDADLARPPHE